MNELLNFLLGPGLYIFLGASVLLAVFGIYQTLFAAQMMRRVSLNRKAKDSAYVRFDRDQAELRRKSRVLVNLVNHRSQVLSPDTISDLELVRINLGRIHRRRSQINQKAQLLNNNSPTELINEIFSLDATLTEDLANDSFSVESTIFSMDSREESGNNNLVAAPSQIGLRQFGV